MRVQNAFSGRRVTTMAALSLLAFVSACAESPPPLGQEIEDSVVEVAAPAVLDLQRTLVTNLTAAIAEGGPVNAIGFCSNEVLSLTQGVQAASAHGLQLKRTSFRYRNPDNAPDEAEELALLYFEEAAQAGETVPSSYVQKVSDQEFRYYKPLFVGEFCLQCHGEREALSPDVRTLLEEKYPGDLAVGYELGAFRGVIRASIPASALAAVSGG